MDPEFKTRPVENPILGSDVKQQISGNGLAGFYAANKLYFWGIGVAILIIVLLSVLLLHKSAPTITQDAKIDINISAPDKVTSGGDEVYKIEINNKDSQKLTDLQLELVYPEGISFQSSSPGSSNLSGTTFSVPDLASGQNAVVIVKTKVTGNVGDNKDLAVKLRYQFSGFTSQFVKEQKFSVQLIASNIAIDLSGPSNANNGQEVNYTITYQNNSKDEAQNSRVTITYPEGFSFAQAHPQPDLGNNTWNIGNLAKGAGGTITIKGTFNSVHPGESIQAIAQFMILGSNGTYFTQSTSQPVITAISDQPLLVSQTVNAPSTNVVNPGDTLSFNIKYQNNTVVAAKSVNVVVSLDSQALDLSSIQAQGAIVNNNTITWNAASVAQLALLAPNEDGDLHFSINIKNPATKDSSTNLKIISHVKIKSDEYSEYFTGGDINLKISSLFNLSSALSYMTGSLPPKVGTNTTYKIVLSLRNSTNDFTDGVLTLFLPLGAGGFNQSSVSSQEQPNVTYDPSLGKLTWKVGKLPAHTGQFSLPRSLEFTVNLNPSPSQANQSPVLAKDIKFNATDSFTQQQVTDTVPDITTSDLPGNNYGNGTVQQ